MQQTLNPSTNWYTRLRDWWENPDADVDVRKWVGYGALLVVVGALMRTPLIAMPGIFSIAIGLIMRLWWDHAMRNLTYERTFSNKRAFYGDEVIMELTATNAKPLPLTRVDVIEQTSPRANVRGQRLYPSANSRNKNLQSMFSLGMYERVAQRYIIDCTQRGW